MNNKHNSRPFLSSLLVAGALWLARSPLSAQTFTYTNCDLVAGFQISGGASDLVVDLGTVGGFLNLPWRTVIAITNLSATQLAAALPTVDGASWSVAAAMRGNTYYPQFPLQTLWVTSPRPSIYTPGPVWKNESVWNLGGSASQIDAIGAFAATYGNGQPAGTDNTATGILMPPASQYAYTYLIGSRGNYGGTFQGDVQNTTPIDFDSAGLPSRSVLYELEPATGAGEGTPGTVIGYFDFKPDGTLVFTSGPPPEHTTISSITRQGSLTTLWFPTVNQVGYRLRYTDGAGLVTPTASWTIGGTNLGTGATLSFTDTNSSPIRFYVIEAY